MYTMYMYMYMYIPILTCSWVLSITLSIVEQRKLLDSLQEDIPLPLRGEVVLFQLFPQLFVVH